MPTVSVIKVNDDKSEEICFNAEISMEETLYDGLDQEGYQLPHGCLSGSCGSCKVNILEGRNLLKPPGAIEQDTIDSILKVYQAKNGTQSLKDISLRMACRTKLLEPTKEKIKLEAFI